MVNSVNYQGLGIIRFISCLYLLFGLAAVVLGIFQVQIKEQQLGAPEVIFFGIMAVGAIGTLLQKNWGRWISYFYSSLLLLGVPVGTVFGVFMIYHLTRGKHAFGVQAA